MSRTKKIPRCAVEFKRPVRTELCTKVCNELKLIEDLLLLKFVSHLADFFMATVQYSSGPDIGIVCKNMTTGPDTPYDRLRKFTVLVSNLVFIIFEVGSN